MVYRWRAWSIESTCHAWHKTARQSTRLHDRGTHGVKRDGGGGSRANEEEARDEDKEKDHGSS